MSSPVLFSYILSGPDAGKALEGEAVERLLADHPLAWAHLDVGTPGAKEWVAEKLPYLDSHAIDALFAEETRPRATEIGDGLLVFLRGVNLNEGAEPDDMVSLRLWIDSERIVSTRRRDLKAVGDIELAVREGRGPQDSGGFLATLVERLTDRMEPVLNELDDSMDDYEEQVVDENDPDPDLRPAINEIRRKAIELRRYIAPQRDAVAAIRNVHRDWIDAMQVRRLVEAQDRLTRFVESLDNLRERGSILKDELASLLADRLNRNTYTLSVIAAIFLPLGFLTGLMGINLGGMPGAQSPYGFWAFTGLLVVIVAAMIWAFRRLKWF
jgi:zinc transporter